MQSRTAKTPGKPQKRPGVTVVLVAVMIIPLMAMVAFAVDYGYLTVQRSELQRAADAAVLAAVPELIPATDGSQDLDAVRARVKEYVNENIGGVTSVTAANGDVTTTYDFTVLDADIEIGRYDPTTIYSGNVTLFNTGTFDAVRVKLRRDASANGPISLFFANVLGFGSQEMEVTATSVLRRADGMKAQGDLLPFAINTLTWDALPAGTNFNIYDDNRVRTADGSLVPGNWGTVDAGYENNSTHDLNGQIIEGLREADVAQLYIEGRITDPTEVQTPVVFQAETGLSVGMKSAVQQIYGQTRIIPIYDTIVGDDITARVAGGNNTEFNIVKWGVVTVIDSRWTGAQNTYIEAIKAWTYDGALVAREDLSDKNAPIENAFTSPVLVE